MPMILHAAAWEATAGKFGWIGREFLAREYSIADIANYSWIRSHKWARVPVDGLANLERWMESLAARPGIQRGCEVPPSPGRADLVKKGGAAITTT